MKTFDIASHSVSIATVMGAIVFAWPLITQAMDYKSIIETAAATAEKNSVTLDKVVVQNTEKTKELEHIADQQKEIKASLDQIRLLLMERNQ